MTQVLQTLPDRGWGVIRAPWPLVFAHWAAGWIKVQVVDPVGGVWQARLTGEGRRIKLLRNSAQKDHL